MLLAEEFVLLALEPDGTLARGSASHTEVGLGVTGALVTELAQRGHVELDTGVIRLTGTRPAEPVLARALDSLARYEGKTLKGRLGSVKHAGWREVVDAMVDAGLVGRVKEGVRATRHPVADPIAHAALLAEVRAAATGTGPMEPRIAVLLALAGPCQLLEVVAPHRSDRAAARARIAEAAEQVPAAKAVKHVVDSLHAAIAVAVASSSAAG